MKNSRTSLFIAFAAAFLSLNLSAQPEPDTLQRIPQGTNIPFCQVNGRYVLESNDAAYGRPLNIFTPQSSMIPASIITCGKFRLYYEDLNMPGVTTGFNDPTSMTAMCSPTPTRRTAT